MTEKQFDIFLKIAIPAIGAIFVGIQAGIVWALRKWQAGKDAEIDSKIEKAVMNSQGITASEIRQLELSLVELKTHKADEERRFDKLENKVDKLSEQVADTTRQIIDAIVKK